MTWRGLKRLRRPANGHGSLVSSTTKLSRPVIVSLCAHPARSNLVSGDPTPRCRFRRSLGLICQGKSPCNAGDIYAAMSQRSCRVRRNDGRYFALSQGHICSASCLALTNFRIQKQSIPRFIPQQKCNNSQEALRSLSV